MPANASWLHEARVALQKADTNFFTLSPRHYWFDFLSNMVLAYSFGAAFLLVPLGSPVQFLLYPLAVFWLYRLGTLVHEVSHLGQQQMRVFKVTWNLLVGVVTLAPSPFFTRQHRDHHANNNYGTYNDPEYVVNFYARARGWAALYYAGEIAVFPLLVFVRFLLFPVSFVHPRLRDFVLRRASSQTMNWQYERKLNPTDRLAITAIEGLCSIRAWMMLAAVLLGWNDWTRLPLFYALGVGALTLNHLRLLGDHHLQSAGDESTMEEQVLDTCNYADFDVGVMLLAPFANRYHALHHMFPSLPYHNLKAAHVYLSQTLDPSSPYHSLNRPSWWSVASKAFRKSPRLT
jgi:fatty acid desaturase